MLGRGVVTPVFFSFRFGISMGRYLTALLVRPLIASVPLIVCLYFSRELFDEQRWISSLLLFGAGYLLLLVTYWKVVLEVEIRNYLVNLVSRYVPVS